MTEIVSVGKPDVISRPDVKTKQPRPRRIDDVAAARARVIAEYKRQLATSPEYRAQYRDEQARRTVAVIGEFTGQILRHYGNLPDYLTYLQPVPGDPSAQFYAPRTNQVVRTPPNPVIVGGNFVVDPDALTRVPPEEWGAEPTTTIITNRMLELLPKKDQEAISQVAQELSSVRA